MRTPFATAGKFHIIINLDECSSFFLVAIDEKYFKNTLELDLI